MLLRPSRRLSSVQRRQRGFIINPFVFPAPGGGSFTVDAADFDGTNDFVRRASSMTGAADSKTGILSAWVYGDTDITSGFGRICYFAGGSHVLSLNVNVNEVVSVSGNNFDVAGTELAISSDVSIFTYNTWHHILVSWDLSAGLTHLYMDGTDIEFGAGATANNDLRYSLMTSWNIGADNGGSGKWNGGIAEVYFAPGQFLDFSVQANREKFRTAAGKPANLGSDGSTPTGSAPLIYCHLDDAESAANFALNRGASDDLTVTGALTTYASSPSD